MYLIYIVPMSFLVNIINNRHALDIYVHMCVSMELYCPA